MSSVLDSIIEGVLEDVERRSIPINQLKAQLSDADDLRGALQALAGSEMKIISEVKRASPSKGDLGEILQPARLAAQYESGGASVISVLTEERRFKGSMKDFTEVRREVSIPMLRKAVSYTHLTLPTNREV